jgi:hypothetical protein
MSPLRLHSVSSASLGKTPLLLRLSLLRLGLLSLGLLSLSLLIMTACSSNSSSTPPPPAPSYALTAAALNPASITAGGTSSSAITVTPATGIQRQRHLSCANITGSHGSHMFLQHKSRSSLGRHGRQFHADGHDDEQYSRRDVFHQRHRQRRQQLSSQQWSSSLEPDNGGRLPAHCGDLSGEPHSR